MAISIPIHKIAKDLGIDSNRVLLACKTLGIYAKGSSKKLNQTEINKIKSYFESGRNVSQETITLNVKKDNEENRENKIEKFKNNSNKLSFFPNRLICND
tara:strand:+ start:131 stop:430 length:300 start_codon:yes stop_codon:yes gene_type:complete